MFQFFVGVLSMTKIAGSRSESGSISQRHGSADPDPHRNVMDPEHCGIRILIDNADPYPGPVARSLRSGSETLLLLSLDPIH
jgi:hypothetical protein